MFSVLPEVISSAYLIILINIAIFMTWRTMNLLLLFQKGNDWYWHSIIVRKYLVVPDMPYA